MNYKFLFALLLIFKVGYSQTTYPQNDFINPLKIPLSLSGNFGELRNNHFHSGLDIRTQQRTGLDVLATADGYISRLEINLYGYGNVLYVQHPNGYTTVYGHLEEFAPKIREYVRAQQYKLEKNTIKLYPKEGELQVKQGEIIAKSGNTGGSGGPHLHYEIRDGHQNPLNPLLFGIKIKDTRAPQISEIYVYPEGEDAYVNKSQEKQKLQLQRRENGTYTTAPIEAHGKIGFGISAVDHTDNAPFKVGIYNIQTCINGDANIDYTFDTFSFANSRYINNYIDYAHYEEHKHRIQKLFLEDNTKVDFTIDGNDKGYVTVNEGLDYNYEITLTDFSGNETLITVPIKGVLSPDEEVLKRAEHPTDFFALVNQPNTFELLHHDIYIPKGALYKDQYLDIKEEGNQIKVADKSTALQHNITIGFDAHQYSPEDFEKLYVARVAYNDRTYYSTTKKDKDRIITTTNRFGTYKLKLDNTPPSILPINFKNGEWVSNNQFLKLKIEDKESGIADYRGTINGKFIVLEYDYKTGIIKYDFRDGMSEPGENNLEIIVIDNVGNSSTYKASFHRKA